MKTTIIGHTVATILALALIPACDRIKAPSSSDAAREVARGAVEVTTKAVHDLDMACAAVVRSGSPDAVAFGEHCAEVYDKVRPGLIAAAVAVDTWDDLAVSRSTVTCAVVKAVNELAPLAAQISGKQGAKFPVVDDAVRLASALGQCATIDGGAS